MPDSVADILLRLEGDRSGAQRALEETAREVRDFGKERATAELRVDGREADRAIQETRRELERVDRTTAEPKVRAQVREALVALQIIEGRVKALKDEKVEIDVKVKQDAVNRLSQDFQGLKRSVEGVVPGIASMGGAASSAFGSLGQMGQGAAGAETGLAGMGGAASAAGPALAVVIPVVFGLVAAALAMVGSLGAAVIALGALGVAALGAVAVFVAFGIGVKDALKELKKTKDGSVAVKQLHSAFVGLKQAFIGAIVPGVKALLQGLIPALRTITPAIKGLGSSFAVFGRALGQAFKDNAPAIGHLVSSFGGLVRAVAPLAGPLVRGLTALFQVLVNIATAAMPFLVRLATAVANAFERWAHSTGAISAVRAVIASVIPHLQSWWNLAKAVAGVMFEFFKTIAPAGKGIVDSLAKGAEALAGWIKAHPEKITSFFKQLIPVAGQFLSAVIKLVPVLLQFAVQAAPLVVKALKLLNEILKVAAPIITGLIGHFGQFKDLLTTLASPINIVGKAIDFLKKHGVDLGRAWEDLKKSASKIWSDIKVAVSNAVNGAVQAVKDKWNDAKRSLSKIWADIRSAASRVWGSIKTTVSNAVHNAVQDVKNKWNDAKRSLSNIWNQIKTAAAKAWNDIKTAISNAVHNAVQAVKDIGKDFYEAGKAIVQKIADGIKAGVGWVKGAVHDVVQQAKDLLPGSEPRDSSSPLAGLEDAGRAIVGNLARGVQTAQGHLSAAVSAELVSTRVAMAGVPAPATSSGGGSTVNFEAHLAAAAPGYADPHEVIAVLEERLRARGGLVPRAGG